MSETLVNRVFRALDYHATEIRLLTETNGLGLLHVYVCYRLQGGCVNREILQARFAFLADNLKLCIKIDLPLYHSCLLLLDLSPLLDMAL